MNLLNTKNKQLNYNSILSKVNNKYFQLKLQKHVPPDLIPQEIPSDQVKAVLGVLVEEINKVLENK